MQVCLFFFGFLIRLCLSPLNVYYARILKWKFNSFSAFPKMYRLGRCIGLAPSVRPRRGREESDAARPGPARMASGDERKRPPSDARAACAPLVGRPPTPHVKIFSRQSTRTRTRTRTLAYPPRKKGESDGPPRPRPAGPGRATLSQSPASTSRAEPAQPQRGRPEHTCSRIKQTERRGS